MTWCAIDEVAGAAGRYRLAWLRAALASGDPNGEVTLAWQAEEALRTV